MDKTYWKISLYNSLWNFVILQQAPSYIFFFSSSKYDLRRLYSLSDQTKNVIYSEL